MSVRPSVLSAVILVDDPALASRRVAGLTVLTRLVRQMCDAGIARLYLVGTDTDQLETMYKDVEERLGCDVHVRIKGTKDPALLPALQLPKGVCFVTRASLSMHPGLLPDVLAYVDIPEEDTFASIAMTKGGETLAAFVEPQAVRSSRPLDEVLNGHQGAEYVVDDSGFHAVDIHSEGDAKVAEKLLFASVKKPLDVDGVICYLMSRDVSLSITKRLLRLPARVRPWHVTLAALLLGLAGGIFAAVGGYWAMLLGAFLYQCSTICDNVDGEIARLTYQGSYWGQWIDTLSDDVTNIFFAMGMGVGLSRGLGAFPGHWDWYWVLSLLTVLMLCTYNFFIYRYLLKYTDTGDVFAYTWFFDEPAADAADESAEAAAPEEKTLFGKIMYYIKFVGRRDFFIFSFLILALFDLLYIGVIAMFIAGGITFALVIVQEIWHNEHVRKAPRPPAA